MPAKKKKEAPAPPPEDVGDKSNRERAEARVDAEHAAIDATFQQRLADAAASEADPRMKLHEREAPPRRPADTDPTG